jgi:hypothetical protein
MEAEQVNQHSQHRKQVNLSVHETFGRSSRARPIPSRGAWRAIIGALALGLTLSASSACAEGHVAGRGMWFTLGGGYGSNRVDCDECEEIQRFSGGDGWLQIGGTLSRNFQIGVELGYWLRRAEPTDADVLALHSIAHWYPFHAGFFIHGGLGVSHVKTSFDIDGETETGSRTGLGVELGLGWDIPVGGGFSLVPSATSMISAVGGIHVAQGELNNIVSTVWTVGLGVSYQFRH